MRREGHLCLMLMLTVAACQPEPAPANPTWVDDVEPLLRGNCFHCHGGGPRPEGALRWDVYNPMEFRGSSGTGAILIQGYIKDPDERRRMPPIPAERLTAREVEIIENWRAAMTPRGRRAFNQKPFAKLVGEPRQEQGDVLVTVDVFDGDGETVMGELKMGAMGRGPIVRTGRQTVRVVQARASDAITYSVSDGQDPVLDRELTR